MAVFCNYDITFQTGLEPENQAVGSEEERGRDGSESPRALTDFAVVRPDNAGAFASAPIWP